MFHLLADRYHRVKRPHRVLKNGGDIDAADILHLLMTEFKQVLSFEQHLACIDLAVLGQQAKYRIDQVDLPQPDSPTTPTMLFSGTEKLTSRRACKSPSSVVKETFRPLISRMFMYVPSCADQKYPAVFHPER